MQPYQFQTFFSFFAVISFVSIYIPKSFCQDAEFVNCGETFLCGSFNISYPFWGGTRPESCGYPGLELACESNVSLLKFQSLRYRILEIDGSQQLLTVARDDLWNSLCPRFIYNTTFDHSIFRYSASELLQNLTFSYGCRIRVSDYPRQPNQFDCSVNGTNNSTSFYSTNTIGFRRANDPPDLPLSKRCLGRKGITRWLLDEEDNADVEVFLRNYGSLAPKYYSFTEIKLMTDSFAHKLGQGGYGFVYKGKLSDGHQVAVKVLRDNDKGNGEDFINEVASISRTSHVNVVTLLGFCYEANRRALVYDFMPNGSLDKFICRKESKGADCRLEWEVLYRIAVGTARGLDYLHQGCNTRIVHFDIKPHNILLDEDFCPKISDFGLAKLCKKKESILSRMEARGTVGYIAPEVVFRGLGGVSHKSDVYSYGMMVLEMVGLKSRVQVEIETTSGETYFPNWIYERLELNMDLELEGVKNIEDEEAAMKIILVGLWCIQTRPSDRPSMSKVVEMLESSIQSLQIPPKPYFLESPTDAAVNSIQESSDINHLDWNMQ